MSAEQTNYQVDVFDGVPLEYNSVRNPAYRAGDSSYLSDWKILQRPAGGFIGSVTVDDSAAAGGIARLRIYKVLPKDLYQPEKPPRKCRWFEDVGLYNKKKRARSVLYEKTWKISDVPLKIPIVLPAVGQGGQKLLRSVFEVLDKKGSVVYSSVPAEVYNVGYYYRYDDVWVLADNESAFGMINKMLGGRSGDIKNVSSLPDIGWRGLLNTKMLWIDDKSVISDDLIKEFILSGGLVSGSAAGLKKHLDKLGVTYGKILGGGILNTDYAQKNPGAGNYSCYRSGNRYQFSQYIEHDSEKKFPFENDKKSFFRLKIPYLIFTIVTMFLYALGGIILLPILFIRLKGADRVKLWWKVPLIITGYTVFVVVIGWILIYPKSKLVDITEYRMGYGNWEKVFCVANADILNYGPGVVGWDYPSFSSVVFMRDTDNRIVCNEGDARSGRVIYKNVVQGLRVQSAICYMKNMRQPFHARYETGRVLLSSDRKVHNVYVCGSGFKWLNIGKLVPGNFVTVSTKFNQEKIHFPGYIEDNLENGEIEYISSSVSATPAKVCKNCGKIHHHASSDSIAVFDGAILVIGVDDTDKPAVDSITGDKYKSGRIAWICQVPLAGYKSHKDGVQ